MKKLFKAISIIWETLCNSIYWFFRDLRYGAFTRNRDDVLNRLLVAGHVLEKGITMPNRRLGFGQDVVKIVIELSNKCISKYGKDIPQLQFALSDLEEYLMIHNDNNFKLPNSIVEGIQNLLKYKDDELIPSKEFTSDTFFEKCNDFKDFAYQRHTVRYFSEGNVPEDLLRKAMALATTAPSACNRQSIRVKVLSGECKERTLQLQNGNRGFGHLVNKLLVITSEQTAWDHIFRTSAYLDAGIFTMNLLYSLHYYKICACTLNAHLSRKKVTELRKIAKMKNSEIPIVFIAIGMPAESFKIASSRRLDAKEIASYV